MYSIYLVTNIVTNKVYIGQTCQGIKRRWREHTNTALRGVGEHYFYRAIRKYGKDNFQIKILVDVDTKEAADIFEKLWILVLDSCNAVCGYNCTYGGEGAIPNAETRAKMGKWQLGRKLGPISSAHRVAIILSNKKRAGEKRKVINFRAHTNSTKEKIRQAWVKRRLVAVSESTRLKMSIAQKKRWLKEKEQDG